jgi:hypothetical protein
VGQAEIVWSSGCCSQVPSAAWLAPGCIMYVCGMLPAAAGHNAFVLRQQCHHQHVHCSDVVTHVAVAACPEVQPCGCCCCLHQPPRKPVTTHCQHLHTQRTQHSTVKHITALLGSTLSRCILKAAAAAPVVLMLDGSLRRSVYARMPAVCPHYPLVQPTSRPTVPAGVAATEFPALVAGGSPSHLCTSHLPHTFSR